MLAKRLKSLKSTNKSSIGSIILLCLISILSIFCLNACSKDVNATTGNKSHTISTQQTLIFGADIYAPYFYLDDDGKFNGIDHDLMIEACKRLGYTPEFRIIDWSKKNELLDRAEIDAIISCFTMEGREHQYTWAGPYLASKQSLMVHIADNINSLYDLNGRKVCIQNTSKPDELFKYHFSPDLKKFPVESAQLVFNTIEEAYTAFKQKACHAVAGHEAVLATLGKNDHKSKILDEYLEAVSLGIAFHKDATPLIANALSQTLNQMTREGITQQIVAKYGIQYLAPRAHSKGRDGEHPLDFSL